MTDAASEARRARAIRLRRVLWQFGRFLLVGSVSFAFDFGLYFVLYEYAGVQYVIASTFSFSLSLILNYFLTLKFVFDSKPGRNVAKEFAIYIGLNIVALGLNQAILFLTVEALGATPLVGKLVATAIVLVYNFISRKLLIERASGTPRESTQVDAIQSLKPGGTST
ncbi:MAG: GtrA family protein [Burkholderiales bacterium]